MAASTIRKAIGVVKDQTSISIAKVAGNVAPDLEVLIVKATGHDNEPAEEKYTREILNLTSFSRSYVSACVYTLSKRLSKTHDWIVALKALMLIHRLLVDGGPAFSQEMMHVSRKGIRVLNMSDFRDEAHSNSWDEAHSNSWEHSAFVKTYAMYLTQKLEFIAFELTVSGKKDGSPFQDGYTNFHGESKYGDSSGSARQGDWVKEMKTEEVLERLHQLLRLLDRVLSCRPTGHAKNSRMVLIALCLVLKESFRVYADMCDTLGVLLERFSQLEYAIGVKAFDESVYAAKMSDELVGFYTWCKDLGVARSSEFPMVQKITDGLLGGLERVLREKKNVPNAEKSKEREKLDNRSETSPNMNEIKALPPPESRSPPPPPPQPAAAPVPPLPTEDLLNLTDSAMSADAHGNNLALALFSAPPTVDTNGSWEVFEPEVTSAWQTPVAENWEVALVESTSNLSKQKVNMAGGLDSLLLNGMYDQGAVRQQMSNKQVSCGSSSSVVMPGLARTATPMLALPAPDGTTQSIDPQDPFAASLTIPPPSYVQIADMEKKQNLLVQEQHAWQQYGSSGMQGQVAFAKINAGYSVQNGYYYAQL